MQSVTEIETGSISIVIKGLRNTTGQLGVALFTSKHGFPDNTEHVVAKTLKQISCTDEEVNFKDIPYGTYAVSVLHDDNCNGKMDKTFVGIPEKGFGVSNNPKIRYGPPDFQESRFTLHADNVDLVITMNYL